jgi:hypothetical protein
VKKDLPRLVGMAVSILNPSGILFIASNLSAYSYGSDIKFFKDLGVGYVEFRNLYFTETEKIASSGGGGTASFSDVLRWMEEEAGSKLVSNKIASYHRLQLSGEGASFNYTEVNSDVLYKTCNPLLNPGHLAIAYCELNDLNGLLYHDENIGNHAASIHWGSSCI